MNLKNIEIQNGELVWAGKKISALHAEYQRMPMYVYDKQKIAKRVQDIKKIFPTEIKLHYAIKANPMPEVVQFLSTIVDGFDVASLNELQLALSTKIAPIKLSLAGPGKTKDELLCATVSGAVINIESFREIEILANIQAELKITPKVALRINPDFEVKRSGMKMGGGPKQFGIDSELIPEAVRKIQKHHFDFEGFHLYSGSQNLDFSSINEAQLKSFDLVCDLKKSLGLNCKKINLGGGFGIPYFADELPLDLNLVAKNLFTIVEKSKIAMPEAELIIELGRYLVGEAGIYVCQIVDKKISRGKIFLVTNGGLHHHLAATGNLGQFLRRSYPMTIGNKLTESCFEEVAVVGPLCTPLDSFADKIQLPRADVGDYVVLFQSGAYGYTASPHLFLSHPPPIEICL